MTKHLAAKESKCLDVRALKIFEAVANSGSISVASAELQITQSAVSQAVAQIEQILGTAVLDRARRPLRLTPAGMTLSRHARQIVHDMDRLIAQVHEADLASRPEIRVGMIDSFAAIAGPSIVKKIHLNASQVLLWSGLAYTRERRQPTETPTQNGRSRESQRSKARALLCSWEACFSTCKPVQFRITSQSVN